jgi:hypothetical protein
LLTCTSIVPNAAGRHLKARSTKSPKWRCNSCFHQFDEPDQTAKEVTAYRSNHAGNWLDLEGLLPGSVLRAVCVNPREQLSLRYLNWDAFVDALDQVSLGTGVRQLAEPERGSILPGGFVQATIRPNRAGWLPRKVAGAIRENCAITGPSIHAGLEAAHLIQYAEHGVHDSNAGLLLRRDLHTLFDRKLLSVNPRSWRVELSPHLLHVPGYVQLTGVELNVPKKPKITGILALHYAEFRKAAAL